MKVVRIALTALGVAILAWVLAPATASASSRHARTSVAQGDVQACECEAEQEFAAGAGAASAVPRPHDLVLEPFRPGRSVLAPCAGRVMSRPARQ